MVLMSVFAVVSEDEVRGNRLLHLFEDRFHFGTNKRHESVWKSLQQWSFQTGGASKKRSRTLRLSLSHFAGTEHDPMKHAARVLLGQMKDCAATAYFDVVGVCSKAQDFEPLGMPSVYV